ncbi:MAG: alpha-amylase family glycosyl hydrolase [Bacteroidota bacterium]|jgi:cyclomaltodextrinase / maltogenic alpha-amylase / neopullulanase
MRYLSFLLLTCGFALLMQSCGSKTDIPVSKEPQMLKLVAPVTVNTTDSTVIELGDYFLYPNKIDSFSTDRSITARITSDSSKMIIKPAGASIPRLGVLTVWSKGFSYSLLLERSLKINYRFCFDPGNKKYRKVQIAGQMNEWNPSASYMFQKDGKWYYDLHLFPGKYQYKIVCDKKWMSDRKNPDSVSNGSGGYNSLLTLGNLNSSNLPVLYTKDAGGKKLSLGLKNKADTIFILWENHILDSKFWKQDSSGIQLNVPKTAGSFERSFIRAWAINKYGTSNEILVPLKDGKVITDASKLTRADQEAMILYFMMVDRFRDGNRKNNAPIADKDIDNKVNYMGGDLDGITKAIDEGYFTKLGVNTLWISPITQNPLKGYVEYPAPHRKFSGYHGYWPITLATVDTRFGTAEELHKLVNDAHGQGLNIVLDFVSHHAHQEYPVFKAHPDWITQLDLPRKRKNIRLFDEQRLTTWFDIFLPTFDLTKPEVTEMVSDSAAFWIREYNIDGFRHDAAKHVPENYWRVLTKKLNLQVEVPQKRKVYQIGETFGSRELIKSYISPGMLDAQFEFNLYWDAKNTFAQDYTSFRDLNYSLQQSFSYFGEHNLMGNITGNQDMSRFISFASGALSFNEDEHDAGWKRDVEVKDTVGYRKLASLMAFNMSIPGIPVIYYGDEYGMPGAGDPDNRRMMKFDSLNPHERHNLALTTKLVNLRRTSMPLIYGDFTTIKTGDKVFIYMRSYFDKAVIVIFNKDRNSKKIEFDIPERFAGSVFTPNFGGQFSSAKGKATIDLGGNSFEILSN